MEQAPTPETDLHTQYRITVLNTVLASYLFTCNSLNYYKTVKLTYTAKILEPVHSSVPHSNSPCSPSNKKSLETNKNIKLFS